MSKKQATEKSKTISGGAKKLNESRRKRAAKKK